MPRARSKPPPRSRSLALLALVALFASLVVACTLIVEPTRVVVAREDGGAGVGDGAPREAGVDAAAPSPDAAADAGLADGARDGAGGDGDAGCALGQKCDDGDPCTIDDVCDSLGRCSGKRAPDGTQCKQFASSRCCGGICRNTAADENHCGGCGIACRPGYACRGVAQTTACASAPANLTGRCRCANGNDALCPKSQSCRSLTPEAGYCSPKALSHCAPGQRFRNITNCPNYCYYP